MSKFTNALIMLTVIVAALSPAVYAYSALVSV